MRGTEGIVQANEIDHHQIINERKKDLISSHTLCRDELHRNLVELEKANLLRPNSSSSDGDAQMWEFNMIERDIIYEVLPHYQRRRLHAQLAQELERTLEEGNIGTLTTVAYHWHQVGHDLVGWLNSIIS